MQRPPCNQESIPVQAGTPHEGLDGTIGLTDDRPVRLAFRYPEALAKVIGSHRSRGACQINRPFEEAWRDIPYRGAPETASIDSTMISMPLRNSSGSIVNAGSTLSAALWVITTTPRCTHACSTASWNSG